MNFNTSKLVYSRQTVILIRFGSIWVLANIKTHRENMSSLFPDKCGDISRSYKRIKGLHKDSQNSETTVYKPCSDPEFFHILQMDALKK